MGFPAQKRKLREKRKKKWTSNQGSIFQVCGIAKTPAKREAQKWGNRGKRKEKKKEMKGKNEKRRKKRQERIESGWNEPWSVSQSHIERLSAKKRHRDVRSLAFRWQQTQIWSTVHRKAFYFSWWLIVVCSSVFHKSIPRFILRRHLSCERPQVTCSSRVTISRRHLGSYGAIFPSRSLDAIAIRVLQS